MTDTPDTPPRGDRYDDRMARYMINAVEIIDRHGWMVQGVMAAEGDEPSSPFCYTVGLTARGLPELLIFGPPTLGDLLNALAPDVEEFPRAPSYLQGKTAAPGIDLAIIDATEQAGGYVTMPGVLYPLSTISVLQVVWPDDQNRFPWQEGYSLSPDLQPILGERP